MNNFETLVVFPTNNNFILFGFMRCVSQLEIATLWKS